MPTLRPPRDEAHDEQRPRPSFVQHARDLLERASTPRTVRPERARTDDPADAVGEVIAQCRPQRGHEHDEHELRPVRIGRGVHPGEDERGFAGKNRHERIERAQAEERRVDPPRRHEVFERREHGIEHSRTLAARRGPDLTPRCPAGDASATVRAFDVHADGRCRRTARADLRPGWSIRAQSPRKFSRPTVSPGVVTTPRTPVSTPGMKLTRSKLS